jgi:DNA-binding MarR family transcriptional regulator
VSDSTLQQFVQGQAANSAGNYVKPFPQTAAHGRRNGLSARQLDVLRALIAGGGSLPAGQLVRQHGGLLSVARASTSRSLRRLWRAGLVELFEKRGVKVDERRLKGAYVTRVAVTTSGIDAVKSHDPMKVNRRRNCEESE